MATVRRRHWTSPKGERKSAWVLRYTDQQGKRRLKTFARRKAADAYLVQAGHEVAQGVHTPDSVSLSVADAGRGFLARCDQGRGRRGIELERSTTRQYASHVNRHIVPRIGAERLSRLTTPRCEAFAQQLAAELTPAMARKVLTTFKSLVADAAVQGIIGHNPAQAVSIRQAARRRRKVTIPTKDDVRALLAAAEGRWRPLIATAVFTGLRASELRGLAWADVDLKGKTIRVSQRADRWGTIGSPKTEESARVVPMTPGLAKILRAWRLACPKGRLDLVFPNGDGKVENLGNIFSRGLGPLQIACGIVRPAEKDATGKDLPPRAKYGIHKLRHFYASWLIDEGFGPKRVQELMGHATIQVTFDIYGHLFPAPEADRARMAAAERALIG